MAGRKVDGFGGEDEGELLFETVVAEERRRWRRRNGMGGRR
jgi:hypothetical protein